MVGVAVVADLLLSHLPEGHLFDVVFPVEMARKRGSAGDAAAPPRAGAGEQPPDAADDVDHAERDGEADRAENEEEEDEGDDRQRDEEEFHSP